MSIAYGGTDPFVGQPIPLVKLQNGYSGDGSQRVDRTVLILNGSIVACSKADLLEKTNTLKELFSAREELEIDGLGTFQVENVVEISFQDSDYFSKVPYTIQLQVKDANVVLDKSITVEFQENADETLDVVRTIAAKGKNATDQIDVAWNNVLNYVRQVLTTDIPRPFSIGTQLFSYFLVSTEEAMDRVNKTISVTQRFKSNLNQTNNSPAILRYTIEVNKTNGENTEYSISGAIECGRENGTAQGLSDYNLFKQGTVLGGTVLIKGIKNEQLSVDENAGNITFSFNFSDAEENNPNDITDLTYVINLEEDSDGSLISANVNGTLKLVNSFTSAKKSQLLTEFIRIVEGSNYLYDKINTIYKTFYNANSLANLNPFHISRGYSFDRSSTSITFSASFNDRFQVNEFKDFNYSLSVSPAIKSISVKPGLNGYSFLDLGYNTAATAEIALATLGCENFEQKAWVNMKLLEYVHDDKIKPKQYVLSESESSDNSFKKTTTVSKTYEGRGFEL